MFYYKKVSDGKIINMRATTIIAPQEGFSEATEDEYNEFMDVQIQPECSIPFEKTEAGRIRAEVLKMQDEGLIQ